MSRRYVAILVLVAVALTCFSIALSRRDSRDWRANRSRRLLPFPWQDTVGVTIARQNGETLKFSRGSGMDWLVEQEDGNTDALNSAVSEDLAALATLARRDPYPDRQPPSQDAAVSLVATNQAGQQARLDFGDVQDNIRAVVVDGDRSVVYGVNQNLLAFLDWPVERLRSMYLASVAGGIEPDKIRLAPEADDPSLIIALERQAGGWRMTTPADWPADPARIDLLLRWLDRLHAETIATETPKNLEVYGLDAPTGFIEAEYLLPDGKLIRHVDLGKESGTGGIYARVKDREPVFVVSKETLGEISMIAVKNHAALWKNFFRRRNLDLLDDPGPVLHRIEQLLPESAALTIEKTSRGDAVEWVGRLEDQHGVRTFPVEAPTPEYPLRPLSALEYGLRNLRVKSFLADDESDPAASEWTKFPAWKLSQRYADGTESPVLTLYAADAAGSLPSGTPYVKGDAVAQNLQPTPDSPELAGFAFSLSGNSAVMETFAAASLQFCLPPYRYQSKRLLYFQPQEFVKIAVKAGKNETVFFRRHGDQNEQWWKNPASPDPLMDDNNRLVGLLHDLARLTAEGFVSDGFDDTSEFGLDQPEITAIVYGAPDAEEENRSSQNSLFTLTVGKKASRSASRYARLDDGGPVFLIPEKMALALDARYR